MKKMLNCFAAMLAVFAVLAGLDVAHAQTPVTEAVTVPIAGTATWTNARDYYALKLVSIEAFAAGAASSTCAVSRVRSGRTNTVASIAISSNAGISRETNTVYLFKGDQLLFTMTPLTNVAIEITGELYP